MVTRTTVIATLGILMLGAFALPATAQDEQPRGAAFCEENPEHRRCQHAADQQARQACRADPEAEGCAEMRRQHQGFHEARAGRMQAHCAENPDDERCERIRAAQEPCARARRADNALTHAIEAHERRLVRLVEREDAVQARIAGGELNETQQDRAERMLERIDAAQERTEARIVHLEERQSALRERAAARCQA